MSNQFAKEDWRFELTFDVRAFKTAEICMARGAETRDLAGSAIFCPDRKVEAEPKEDEKAAVCIASMSGLLENGDEGGLGS